MKTARVQGLLTLLVLMGAPVTLASAQTKMFKCLNDGHTVYQQTACPVNQEANDMASAGQSASVRASASSPMGKREKAAARAAAAASAPAAETAIGRAISLQ